MAPGPIRALKMALETGNFDPAYLFYGDEEFLKEEMVRALIDRATDEATRDFNLEVRRAAELEPSSLRLALETLPVMAPRRVVVIRDISALRKDPREVLLQYLEHPAADIVLLLVAGRGSKADAALNRATTPVAFNPLTDEQALQWVSQRFALLGSRVTPGAAQLLCQITSDNLTALAGEIEKLHSYASGSTVDEAAVATVTGARKGETIGNILDLAGARDGASAISLLERVLAQPKATGVSLVMALTTQTLAIGWVLAMRRSQAAYRPERDLYDLLGENRSSVVGRPWSEAVVAWARAAPMWEERAINQALTLLCAADVSLKESRVSTEEQLLTSLLLALTGGARGHVAA